MILIQLSEMHGTLRVNLCILQHSHQIKKIPVIIEETETTVKYQQREFIKQQLNCHLSIEKYQS